jgi:hypothetical protein
MEEALVRVKEYTLADAMPRLIQPLLIVYGANEKGFAVEDAQRALDAAGLTDKTLRSFTLEEGGAEHVNADDPDPAREVLVDWFAQRLAAAPSVRERRSGVGNGRLAGVSRSLPSVTACASRQPDPSFVAGRRLLVS